MAENKIESRIQLSRAESIENSRAIAVLRLNERDFLKGEVALISYYKNEDLRSDVGTLVALGISDGRGEEHYRILNTGDSVLVRGVVEELPDVSSLVHGEVYVYVDQKGAWYYVYKRQYEPERTIEPITGGPFVFIDTETGYRWFYRNQTCQREDDFLSTTRIKDIFQRIILNDGYLEVTSRNGYIFEFGKVKDVNLEIKVWNRAQTKDISDQCSFYINDEQISLDSNGYYVYSSVSKDTVLEVEARVYLVDEMYLSFSRQIDIYFGYKFYYGVVDADWEPTNAKSITSLSNVTLSRKIDFEWSGIYLKLQKTAFCYPKIYGYLEHIYDDNGLDYIRDYQVFTDIMVDGISYLVYTKTTEVTISDFRQIFSFEPFALIDKTLDLSNVTDVDSENLLNIVKAWRKRNMAGGMLILDEDGKIPSEILYGGGDFIGGQVLVVSDEFEHYPLSGMTKGCIYYITSEKKFYHALDEDRGEVIVPEENKIYIFYKDLSVRKWNQAIENFEYDSSFGYKKISSIEELWQ